MKSMIIRTLVVVLVVVLDPTLCKGGRPMVGNRQQQTTVTTDDDLVNNYLRRYGYLIHNNTNNEHYFKSALLLLQTNMGLPPTGSLDAATATAIMQPRCGVPDATTTTTGKRTTTRRFSYFFGQPRWDNRTTLSYAFSPGHSSPASLSPAAVRAAFARSFARWSAVVPLNFTLSDDYSSADIRIGFFRGEHGDGEPFDGVLGVLAHAFSPQNGRFHLDAAESWALDRFQDSSAIHLESVVTHEIGHVLGLGHSSVREAVMYPSLSPRTEKLRLHVDDVRGVQALYGSNPHFRLISDSSNYYHQSLSTSIFTIHTLHTHISFSLFLLLFLAP